MTQKITPCLWFDTQWGEAATYYNSIFRNSEVKSISPVMSEFSLDWFDFLAINWWPVKDFKMNPSISFFVRCATKEDIDVVWHKLSEGGIVMMELGSYGWSEYYGRCADKFWVTWQVMLYTEEWQHIVPSFLFTQDKFGKAREAIDFYTSTFKNSGIDRMAEYPEGDTNHGKVMYAEFHLDWVHLCAMDGPGMHDFTFNEWISLSVSCDWQEEVDYFWNALLADGGVESQCGWLKDKFGVSRQIVPIQLMHAIANPDREKSTYAMSKMLKMRKIIIEDLYQK